MKLIKIFQSGVGVVRQRQILLFTLPVVAALLALLLVLSPGGLSGLAHAYGLKDDSEVAPGAVDSVARGINQFGIDLLKRMGGRGNVLISPVSVEFALAIVAEGAKGKTFEEMTAVLHLPEESVRRPAFARIYNLLNRRSDVTVELANALWLRPGFTPRQGYLSLIQRYYPADVYASLDPARINGWVRERTHGKIDKIVDSLPPETMMVITNAVYFYGDWAKAFDREETRRMPFHAPGGDKDVDMMHDRRTVPYYEDADVQAVLLPYKDGNFAMVVLLPRGDVDAYLSTLSAERLASIVGAMREEDVDLYLPRFELDTGPFVLNRQLQDLGMRTVFTPSADLSGIWGNPGDLYVDKVVHRVYVRVDEKGTEAAAATGVVVVATCAGCGRRAKVFRVDRPFLFFVVDRRSGVVLFAGRVTDPAKPLARSGIRSRKA